MPRITDFDVAGTLAGGEHIHLVQPSSTVTITATTISAQASDNSFNDSGSGFAFAVGDRVVVSGFPDAGTNLEIGVITSATAGTIIIGGTDGDAIVDQAEGSTVTISKLVSRRATAQEIASLGGGGGGQTTTHVEVAVSAAASTIWDIPANCVAFTIVANLTNSSASGATFARLYRQTDSVAATFDSVRTYIVRSGGATTDSTSSTSITAMGHDGAVTSSMGLSIEGKFPRASGSKTMTTSQFIATGTTTGAAAIQTWASVANAAEDHDQVEIYCTAGTLSGTILISYTVQ